MHKLMWINHINQSIANYSAQSGFVLQQNKSQAKKIIDFQPASVFNASVKLCIIGQHREDEDEVGIEQSF